MKKLLLVTMFLISSPAVAAWDDGYTPGVKNILNQAVNACMIEKASARYPLDKILEYCQCVAKTMYEYRDAMKEYGVVFINQKSERVCGARILNNPDY